MKKIRVLTLTGDYNIGNKLQNYALMLTLSKFGNYDITSLWNMSLFKYLKRYINLIVCRDARKRNFILFSKRYIKERHFFKSEKANYIIGSDQVWNYNFADLDWFFCNKIKANVINSYAASFGVEEIPKKLENKYADGLLKIRSLSVREKSGQVLVNKLTGRDDVDVVLDPTMLLTCDEWDKISKRPKKLNDLKSKKYILTYFLGDLSGQRRNEIYRIANEYDCHVINLLDKGDPFYNYGPSEFLYLEKHAFLICTDSFHSSVFAILYNRPFVVFDRQQKGFDNMGSRIDTLLNMFELNDRRFIGKITNSILKSDYKKAYKILEVERQKSNDFIKKILNTEC